jgi:hypothetical protein
MAAKTAALAAADDEWAALEAEMAAQTASAQRVAQEHAVALAESRAADLVESAARTYCCA